MELPRIRSGAEGKNKVQFNKKKRLSITDLKSVAPQQRSGYMAYEDPPKDIADAQQSTVQRLAVQKKKLRELSRPPDLLVDVAAYDKHAKLIGQLKAAEARNRLRIMRLRYQANKAQEITHLISCQPSAIKAVRFQALVPAYAEQYERKDHLDKLDRVRIEKLLEDNQGLLTNRIH